MAPTPVEAVWVWNYNISAQKATYGRFNDDSSFSKDYLQVSGNCSKAMDQAFPFPAGVESRPITYKWPGGEAPGSIKHPNDRRHLRWETTQQAPRPWRMTPTPSSAGPESIPGNPDAATSDDANSALNDYRSQGLDAYLVAVKLSGRDSELHIRSYIRNPPADLEFADADFMPKQARRLLDQLSPKKACASAYFGKSGATTNPGLEELISKLEDNPNLLLIGPPGTGKSVLVDSLAEYIDDPASGLLFNPDENHDAWSETKAAAPPGKSRTIVFHPSYSYDNLVVGLLPKPTDEGGVGVQVSTGPLVNLAHYAATTGNRTVLVLDEFNRGNAAAILGDTLALLDKDKRGVGHIDLPYSDMQMKVADEFAPNGETTVSSRFSLPPNLWIVAAMNSSDRSVAPLDAALRRRFSIFEMGPDYGLLRTRLQAQSDADLEADWDDWSVNTVAELGVQVLQSLNERIEAVAGRDFVLGHSNFWHIGGESAEDALRSLATAWDGRIVNTLRLAFQDDDDALAAIMRAGDSTNARISVDDRAAWWKIADSSLGSYARARLHFNELEKFTPTSLLSELRRLAGIASGDG